MSKQRHTDRKTSGSYYTPLTLVDALLDSTLDPLIEEAVKAPDPERALLELTVCDPSCGAGVFLVRASRRIATRVAAVRAARQEPSTGERERARRDVATNQIYGVDLNPVAVDLTRLCLSAEAAAQNAPNPLLDHRIKHGNALLGTTPALLA
ncbi:DNA methyltransferase [Actinomadura sp. 3N407]|uniref:DNA methyltransferase n=1 Tax=Actinomadura sp. 3N407 TaxID=3457423 RepID=UPI003FCD152F